MTRRVAPPDPLDPPRAFHPRRETAVQNGQTGQAGLAGLENAPSLGVGSEHAVLPLSPAYSLHLLSRQPSGGSASSPACPADLRSTERPSVGMEDHDATH